MPEQPEVQQLVGHLFRHEAGKMAAVLSRLLGFTNLETAEDIVQDTLLQAMNSWKIQGIPDNPSGWLYTVAKNKTLDVLRKQKRIDHESQNVRLASEWTLMPSVNQMFLDKEIEDSQLRMMFACCHPSIPVESQIAIILKTLCGLHAHEIALGFLTNDDVIAKRIYRAKEKIKQENITLEVPIGNELQSRLNTILKALYLLFNEGYNSSGAQLIRQDLCEEAIRLCLILTNNSVTQSSPVYALLSLMCFQASRFDTRLDNDGAIVLLKDQDRRKWNKELIARGQYYLKLSAEGNEVSEYHIESALASCHAQAEKFEDTNWDQIIYLYSLLLKFNSNPIIEFNKAIAMGYKHGASVGIDELLKLDKLAASHYYYTALGDFYAQLNNKQNAHVAYHHAIELTESKKELELLYKKLNEVTV
jgi:RNA polymerase sigma factor (sigma-70 family)